MGELAENTQNGGNDKVELLFPKLQASDNNGYISKGKTESLLNTFSANVDEISSWFKQYQVDSIEIWISGVIETGGIIRLVVSAKGEGGLRITLKPKGQT
jgi:hypothetical protein